MEAFFNERGVTRDKAVLKFGGTSVDKISQIASIAEGKSQERQQALVVSAFSGETNHLLKEAAAIFQRAKNGGFSTLQSEGIRSEILPRFEARIDHALEKAGQYFLDVELDVAPPPEILINIRASLQQYLEKIVRDISGVLKKNPEDLTILDEKYIEDRIVSIGEGFAAETLVQTMNTREDIYQVVHLDDLLPLKLTEWNDVPDRNLIFEQIIQGIRERVQPIWESGKTPIMPGYVGNIPGGILETVDRGYTDYTAALTAEAMKGRLEIWKEVPGLMSADPRLVEKGYMSDDGKTSNASQFRTVEKFQQALLRDTVTDHELAELSCIADMKAVNARAVYLLHKYQIPISVRNTYDPQNPGTTVTYEEAPELQGLRFVGGKKGQVMYELDVHNPHEAARIFRLCKKYGISVDAISTSPKSIVFTVDEKDLKANNMPGIKEQGKKLQFEQELQNIGGVQSKEKLALLCCIGNHFRKESGLLGRLTSILARHGINVEFDGGDANNNINFVIEDDKLDKALKILHAELFEGRHEEGENEDFAEKINFGVIESVEAQQEQMVYEITTPQMVDETGYAARIFDICDELNISINAITTSASTVAFCLDSGHPRKADFLSRLQAIADIKIYPNLAMISCDGHGFRNQTGLLSELARVLAEHQIDIVFDSGNADSNITFMVPMESSAQAQKLIKDMKVSHSD